MDLQLENEKTQAAWNAKMADNVTTYVDYFRQLAVRHKELKHDPQTEIGKGNPKDKRFTTFGNNEVIAGLRTQVSFPALYIELYDESGNGENAYDIRQKPKGSFMVLEHAENGNFVDELRAYAVTEEIVYDILKQLYQDHAPGTDACVRPFKNFSWNYEKTPTGKLFENEYGWYVQFDFEFNKTVDITAPPAAGTFD